MKYVPSPFLLDNTADFSKLTKNGCISINKANRLRGLDTPDITLHNRDCTIYVHAYYSVKNDTWGSQVQARIPYIYTYIYTTYLLMKPYIRKFAHQILVSEGHVVQKKLDEK